MSARSALHRPDPALLAELRARIARIEGGGAASGGAVLPFGVEAVDTALPRGGLARAALHAVAAAGKAGDRAASGFAAALLGRLAGDAGTVLWCRRDGDLYGPGLAPLGIDPARLVVVRAHRDADVLWAVEEALKSAAPAAVLGEVDRAPPVAGRRLQLAAEAGGVTALLLFARGAKASGAAASATTLWRVAAVPSASPYPGPGAARWRVELVRSRGGGTGIWDLECRNGEWWHGTANGFALAADVPDRSSGPVVEREGAPGRTASDRLAG